MNGFILIYFDTRAKVIYIIIELYIYFCNQKNIFSGLGTYRMLKIPRERDMDQQEGRRREEEKKMDSRTQDNAR